MSDTLLSLENVAYIYSDGHGLSGITLEIEAGDRLAVVGGNGSGKSTLSRIITGQLEPTGGAIEGTCRIPEDVGTAADLRLFDKDATVTSVLQALGGGESPDLTLAAVALEPDVLNRRIGKLSAGERFRIALAAQLANRPPLLVLDAPSALLDVRSAETLVDALNNRREALVVFSADITVAIETCQRVIILDQGKIVAAGSTIDLLTDSELLKQHAVEIPSALSPSWLRRRARNPGAKQALVPIGELPQKWESIGAISEKEIAAESARRVEEAFETYRNEFKSVTRRASDNFVRRSYSSQQIDAQIRLLLHRQSVNVCVETIKDLLSGLDETMRREVWVDARHIFAQSIAWRSDSELAETHFNSVTRRVFPMVGFDDDLEFRWFGGVALPIVDPGQGEVLTFRLRSTTSELVRKVLVSYSLGVSWIDLDRDAEEIASAIDQHLSETWESTMPVEVDMLKPVFYRNRGAYLVGRIRHLTRVSPFIIPLRSLESGVVADAALLTENATSRIFGFTRSYFHVDAEEPGAVVAFVKSLIPLKPVAELYTAIGHSAHGKTSLFRAIYRHLSNSADRFQPARGVRGMVMIVFTLPSFGVVFKVIKDTFPPSKKITRTQVLEKYQMVFTHDRVGRMVDAQLFEDLAFPRDRFGDELLEELANKASRSVTITETDVIFHHIYTERKVYPLDLYIEEMPRDLVTDAVLDYGNAIKELGVANIFPGDLFTKNFGVTRHGSVVFYDYDELTFLDEVNFRSIPQARTYEDELSSEPWFTVGADDVFPEEFKKFFRFPDKISEKFERSHGDLCDPEMWIQLQELNQAPDSGEFFPYSEQARFNLPE
jgi:isocitrate dehydrogenase kinase/phosphatase|tara:strand:- start:3849 stop:6347 length:2499 start_codon:yes stop_codon:yes gene_type:complete